MTARSAVRPAPQMLRPLGLAEVLDGAVRLVRSGARVAVPLALPFAIGRAALAVGLGYATINHRDAALLDLLAQVFVAGLLGTVLTGLLAPLFGAALLGDQLDGRANWQRARRRVGALVMLAFAVALGEELGLVALVVGGLWLWGIWAVAAPALVLEGVGPRRALRRSFELVRRQFWRTFGVRALGFFLVTVLAQLITLPFQALAAALTRTNPLAIATEGVSNPTLYLAINAVGTLLAGVVVLPISSAIDVLLYVDLRMRAEGMDIVLGLPPLPLDVS